MNVFSTIMASNYLDLGGTSLRKCGNDNDDDGDDVATKQYIPTWFYRWLPAQILGWYRENANACYYFNEGSDFIRNGAKITGFKSQSKYHPIDAVCIKGLIKSVQLPTKKFCAEFAGATQLEAKDINLSEENLYVTTVTTVKLKEKSVGKQQIFTDNNRALNALGDKLAIYGLPTPMAIRLSRGLNAWNTVWIQWGTTTDKVCNVYIGIGKDVKHEAFTTGAGGKSHTQLHIGAAQGGSEGLVGSIAAFEVYIAKDKLPDDLREQIFKDHQSIVGIKQTSD